MTAAETLTGAPSAWDNVQWDIVDKQVRRLQMRIAKAVREGRFGKAKSLQRLLTRSFYGKLTAVKRVVSNKGSKTPGIDGEVWWTSHRKWRAVHGLKQKGYRTRPLRRVYIPKANDELRPLSIPVMKCRAMQALYLLALEPITETLADPHSYGFRPKRSVADAIEQCFKLTSRKMKSWTLEGDIKSCFDKISHDWLLSHVPMERKILRRWLKAGYMDSETLYETEEGTPQGGIISPTLLVYTLTGLQAAIRKVVKEKDRVNVVIYADDFIVTAKYKEVLEEKVRPVIVAFLGERGLELSRDKTTISHIDDGFDFLGFNIRKINGKLLIRPSKKGIKRFLSRVRETVKSNKAAKTESVIHHLNRKIVGWTNFYRHVCSAKPFRYIDHHIFWCLYRWARRRHPHKRAKWIEKKYFTSMGFRRWIFFARPKTHLRLAADVRIVRHLKIKAKANPYSPADQAYFRDLAKIRQARKQAKDDSSGLFCRKYNSWINSLE